jgi:hypothetical protein
MSARWLPGFRTRAAAGLTRCAALARAGARGRAGGRAARDRGVAPRRRARCARCGCCGARARRGRRRRRFRGRSCAGGAARAAARAQRARRGAPRCARSLRRCRPRAPRRRRGRAHGARRRARAPRARRAGAPRRRRQQRRGGGGGCSCCAGGGDLGCCSRLWRGVNPAAGCRDARIARCYGRRCVPRSRARPTVRGADLRTRRWRAEPAHGAGLAWRRRRRPHGAPPRDSCSATKHVGVASRGPKRPEVPGCAHGPIDFWPVGPAQDRPQDRAGQAAGHNTVLLAGRCVARPAPPRVRCGMLQQAARA